MDSAHRDFTPHLGSRAPPTSLDLHMQPWGLKHPQIPGCPSAPLVFRPPANQQVPSLTRIWGFCCVVPPGFVVPASVLCCMDPGVGMSLGNVLCLLLAKAHGDFPGENLERNTK